MDLKAALQHFQAAAEEGNPSAQYGLGYMYLVGSGITQDYDKALKLLTAVRPAPLVLVLASSLSWLAPSFHLYGVSEDSSIVTRGTQCRSEAQALGGSLQLRP